MVDTPKNDEGNQHASCWWRVQHSFNNAWVMDFPLCPKTVRNKIQPRTVVFFFFSQELFRIWICCCQLSFSTKDFPQCFLEAIYTCDGVYSNQYFEPTIFSFKATWDSTALDLMQKICLHILQVTSGIHSMTSEMRQNTNFIYWFSILIQITVVANISLSEVNIHYSPSKKNPVK